VAAAPCVDFAILCKTNQQTNKPTKQNKKNTHKKTVRKNERKKGRTREQGWRRTGETGGEVGTTGHRIDEHFAFLQQKKKITHKKGE